MNYKDYQAKKDEYEDWSLARHVEDEPRREAHAEFLRAHRREWNLGPSDYVHLAAGAHVVVRCDGATRYETSLVLRDEPDRNRSHSIGMSVPLLAVSSSQWRLFADVVAAIERWKAGEIDELPPSGVWPGAEGEVP